VRFLIDSLESIGEQQKHKKCSTLVNLLRSSLLDEMGLVPPSLFLFHDFVFFHDPRTSSDQENRKGFNQSFGDRTEAAALLAYCVPRLLAAGLLDNYWNECWFSVCCGCWS
jgi:hypothetical protein